MAKIKHLAIATHDPEGTAQFYQDVMGLKIVDRIDVAETKGSSSPMETSAWPCFISRRTRRPSCRMGPSSWGFTTSAS